MTTSQQLQDLDLKLLIHTQSKLSCHTLVWHSLSLRSFFHRKKKGLLEEGEIGYVSPFASLQYLIPSTMAISQLVNQHSETVFRVQSMIPFHPLFPPQITHLLDLHGWRVALLGRFPRCKRRQRLWLRGAGCRHHWRRRLCRRRQRPRGAGAGARRLRRRRLRGGCGSPGWCGRRTNWRQVVAMWDSFQCLADWNGFLTYSNYKLYICQLNVGISG